MYLFIPILLLIVFAFFKIKYSKKLNLNTINFIDGAPGTGKTALTVYLSCKYFQRERHIYFIKKKLSKIFKFKLDDKPYLYSNLNLKKSPYVPINKGMICRDEFRCSLNSILLIDEFSLFADQNIYGKKYEDICEQMRDFWKLIRHEGFTKCFVNSQNISSINYTLKDCIGSYLWIHSSFKIPFYRVLRVKELTYSRDNSIVNNFVCDSADDLKYVFVPKSIFKKYDSRAYSVFTDNLPVLSTERYCSNLLKSTELVSFMPLRFLYQNLEKKESDTNEE